MNSVEISNLTKSYGNVIVLDQLMLNVEKGKVFALLGPNGSGKSTLIKILTGIIKPDYGKIYILGKSLADDSFAIKNMIGVMPESLGLFFELTIWEHLMLAGDIYGLKRSETEYRTTQLIKNLDLWEHRNTLIKSSSFGMKKKCSFAMAIIHNPQLVFLDEPFEGIDPASSKTMKEIFSILVRRKTTIFLTSHIIDTVEKIVDSFGIIKNGQIVCQMTMNDVLLQNTSISDVYFNINDRQFFGDLQWLEQ